MTKEERIREKIVELPQLLSRVATWKLKSQRIVFTNGCFDILHKGHIQLLLQAAEFGHQLIVGLNTDDSVKKLKGTNRPINNQDDRALLLASQLFVDAVILFSDETPYHLIESIQPDVLVKGGDYKMEQIVGADLLQKSGGSVEIIPLVENHSTTRIIDLLSRS